MFSEDQVLVLPSGERVKLSKGKHREVPKPKKPTLAKKLVTKHKNKAFIQGILTGIIENACRIAQSSEKKIFPTKTFTLRFEGSDPISVEIPSGAFAPDKKLSGVTNLKEENDLERSDKIRIALRALFEEFLRLESLAMCKDPEKLKSFPRLVCGLKQVLQQCQRPKIRAAFVILAHNIEDAYQFKSEGKVSDDENDRKELGIEDDEKKEKEAIKTQPERPGPRRFLLPTDFPVAEKKKVAVGKGPGDMRDAIEKLCQERKIPLLKQGFSKRKLGKLVRRRGNVAAAAIIDTTGVEKLVKDVTSLLASPET